MAVKKPDAERSAEILVETITLIDGWRRVLKAAPEEDFRSERQRRVSGLAGPRGGKRAGAGRKRRIVDAKK